MTKLIFNNGVSIYSKDWETQFNSIDTHFRTFFKYILKNVPDEGGVLTGFTLQQNISDLSKIDIIHTVYNPYENFGIVINRIGTFIATSSGISGISLSDYTIGIKNYVMIKPTTIETNLENGSYSSTGRVSFWDFGFYDTLTLETFEVEVYSETEYNNLTIAERKSQVLIGVVTVPITNTFTFDYSKVKYLSANVQNFIIYDVNVATSAGIQLSKIDTVSTENDSYSGTPTTLEEFLWKIITQIKIISGTTVWDDPTPPSFFNLDSAMNKYRRSGKIESTDFLITFPASWQIKVGSGTLLHYGDLFINTSAGTTFSITSSSSTLDRYDLIYYDPTTDLLQVRAGTAADNPELPVIGTGEIGLLYIFIERGSSLLTSSNIFPFIGFVDNLPYVVKITVGNTSTDREINKVVYYTSTGLYVSSTGVVGPETIKIESEYFIKSNSGWVVTSSTAVTSFYKKYSSGAYQDVFAEFFIFTKENDSLLLECVCSASSDDIKIVIDDDWINYFIISPSSYTGTVPIFITSSLTDGYHTVKIMKATNNVSSITFTKLIYGKEVVVTSTYNLIQLINRISSVLQARIDALNTYYTNSFSALQTTVTNTISADQVYLASIHLPLHTYSSTGEIFINNLKDRILSVSKYSSNSDLANLLLSYNWDSDIILDAVDNTNKKFVFDSFESTVDKITDYSFDLNNVWVTGGDLQFPRSGLAGCGSQNAGLSFGGYGSRTTEEYGGATWSLSGDLAIVKGGLAGCGTQNAGLSFGGFYGGYSPTTEEYSGSVWALSGNLNVPRAGLAGCGSQNAGLSFGGSTSVNSSVTEEYDGTVWRTGGNLTARNWLAGCGTQNAALSFGGIIVSVSAITEEYNGLVWVVGGTLVARKGLAGCGLQNAGLAFGGSTSSYKSTTEEYNGLSWNSKNDLTLGREYLSGCGIQNSALAFGGFSGSASSLTEEYSNPGFSFSFSNDTKKFKKFIFVPLLQSNKKNILSYTLVADSITFSNKISEELVTYTSTLEDSNFSLDIYPFIFSTTSIDSATNKIIVNKQNCIDYLVGKYFVITDSLQGKNDGFYKILSTSDNEIVIDTTYTSFVQSESGTSAKLQSVNLFFKEAGVWITGGNCLVARWNHGGAGTQNAALSFGGNILPISTLTNSSEEYNGSIWATGGDITLARESLAGCGLQNAGLSFGGYINPAYESCTEEYNGLSWTTGGDLNTARANIAGCGLQNAALSFNGYNGTFRNNTEEYNGLVWIAGGNNISMADPAGCGTQNAGLCFGGNNAGLPGGVTKFTEEYNGSVWVTGGDLTTSQFLLSGCGYQNSALSFCGSNGSAPINNTEEYNGISWSNASESLYYMDTGGGCGIQNSALSFGGSLGGSSRSNYTEEYNYDFNLFTGYALKLIQG